MDLRSFMKRPEPPGLPRWLPTALLTGLLLIVASVYAGVVGFGFLPFWDDDTNIHRNPLYSPLSTGSVLLFWTGPFQQLYIPVTYTVWAALVALSRLLAGTGVAVGPIDPALFHGANLAVHLLSTAMVFVILRRLQEALLGDSYPRLRLLFCAAAGSLAFALHPIQVEAVAWVSGLRDLLGGAFSLGAVALFLGFLDEGGRPIRRVWLYVAAGLSLILALGSKPGSVVTPALALICGGCVLIARRRPLQPLLWLLPWFAMAIAEVVMTSKAQPAAELARSLVPLWARPLVAGDALAFYFGKLVWPLPPCGLCADYGRSPNSLFEAGTLFWSWLIPAALAVLLAVRKSLRPYLLPYALLVIGVLPTLGLIPFNFQVVSTVSDRYLYLAMLGPSLALSMALCQAPPRIGAITSLVLLTGWTAATLLRLPEWASGESLFPAILASNSTSWKSRHNHACTLDAQGKFPEALLEFQEAIRLRPSNAEAYNDLGLTLLKMGRRREAITGFQQSLQVRATSGAARNLAAVLLMNGDAVEAAGIYRLAMRIDPADLQNHRALAWLLATHPDNRVRDGAEAVALSESIVSATGGEAPLFLLTLSASLAESGNFDRAIDAASASASAYERSGDQRMAGVVRQSVIPALHNHQSIRDNPTVPTLQGM
jgi:tetratricopeptide (TPR) repeat protein